MVLKSIAIRHNLQNSLGLQELIGQGLVISKINSFLQLWISHQVQIPGDLIQLQHSLVTSSSEIPFLPVVLPSYQHPFIHIITLIDQSRNKSTYFNNSHHNETY